MNFKNLPNEEKPRERFIKYGKENISNDELIEIILGSGTRKYGLKEISHNILSSVNNINELKNMEVNTLTNIAGVSKIKAIELLSAIELGRRIYMEDNYKELVYLTNPESIINYFHNLFDDIKQEHFYVVYLDNQKKYIDKKLLFKGTVNYSLVHPREIFKEAYMLSSSYIICIHNHPSGNSSPSDNDIELTKRIKQLGILHGINLIDHIIIGKGNYYSFYQDNNL